MDSNNRRVLDTWTFLARPPHWQHRTFVQIQFLRIKAYFFGDVYLLNRFLFCTRRKIRAPDILGIAWDSYRSPVLDHACYGNTFPLKEGFFVDGKYSEDEYLIHVNIFKVQLDQGTCYFCFLACILSNVFCLSYVPRIIRVSPAQNSCGVLFCLWQYWDVLILIPHVNRFIEMSRRKSVTES